MKDFFDQAEKNKVKLLKEEKYQFCGADYQNGIFECMENYNQGHEFLDFTNAEHHIARFLSVDAHALQHPEIHGRWSNHFHLTRLNLIFEKKAKWDYKKSPLLSNYLNEYKASRPNEFLISPKPMERGNLTAKDLTKSATAEECVELVKQWATEVYDAWNLSHSIVLQIAEGFLEKNNNIQKHLTNKK
jgi:Family of unknown function (DUF5946)